MRSAYPAVLLFAVACATAPASSRSSVVNKESAVAPLAAPSANSLTRGTLLTGNLPTEYYSGETLADVLRRRAPIYLRPRGGESGAFTGRADPIAVYINGNFAGPLDVLASIPAYDVHSVQRVSATESMMRFGPKHNNGVLMVTLRQH